MEENQQEANTMELEIPTRKLLSVGITKKFWSIETDRKDLFEKLKNTSSFLWGDVGTGKSVLAASIAKDYLKRNGRVKWINYPDFIKQIKIDISHGDLGYLGSVDHEQEAANFGGVLFVDDLGAERLTDFVKEVTYRMFNTRELNLLPTVITSNYSLDEIDQFIDRRISSRIIGICYIQELTGKDQRMASKSYNFETPTVEEKLSNDPMPDECRKKLEALDAETKERGRSAGMRSRRS